MSQKHSNDEPRRKHEKPVTVAPLSFEEAVAGLLQVKPDPDDEPKGRAKKRPRSKAAQKGVGSE